MSGNVFEVGNEFGNGSLRYLDGVGVIGQELIIGVQNPGLVEVDGFLARVAGPTGFGDPLVALGNAQLEIKNGGEFAAFDITDQSSANSFTNSVITVDGSGSTLTTQMLELGISPLRLSQLTISNGARLDSGNAFLGGQSSSSGVVIAEVTGVGSVLTVQSPLVVGARSSLTIRNGGTVATNFTAVQGSLTLDGGLLLANGSGGAPQLSLDGTLRGDGLVGQELQMDLNARLSVGPGQTLTFNAPFALHDLSGVTTVDAGTLEFIQGDASLFPSGSIVASNATLAADQWFLGGPLSVVGGGTTEVFGRIQTSPVQDGGAVRVAENSTVRFFANFVNNDEVDVRPGSTATFLDVVQGNGSFVGGGDFVFLGTLAPGNSPAEVSFQGDVTLGTSSTLDIELAGLTNGSFDRLDVSGDAAIAGSLVVTAIDGFQPLPGDSFEIIAADAVAGTFDAVTNAFGLVGLGLDVDYFTDAVVLEPTRLLDGDANFDGVVDLADFGLLRAGFGDSGRNAADFNLDGTVDLADFGILRAFFGQSLGGDLGARAGDLAMMDAWAATVPEPASVALLVPAGLTLLRRRRS
ncbi:MAG: hypothetical protein AAGI46_11560 [Planctomycetota bacterium]